MPQERSQQELPIEKRELSSIEMGRVLPKSGAFDVLAEPAEAEELLRRLIERYYVGASEELEANLRYLERVVKQFNADREGAGEVYDEAVVFNDRPTEQVREGTTNGFTPSPGWHVIMYPDRKGANLFFKRVYEKPGNEKDVKERINAMQEKILEVMLAQ